MRNTGAFAIGRQAVFGPTVEHRILALARNDIHTCINNLFEVRSIEVGDTDVANLTAPLEFGQVKRGLHIAGHVIVPPMELHKVEGVTMQAAQASIDNRFGVRKVDIGQNIKIGHVLGMDLDLIGRNSSLPRLELLDESAQKLLYTGVDIAAIEGSEATLRKLEKSPRHIVEIDGARQGVALRELPATVDHAAYSIAGRQLDAFGSFK